MKKNEPKTMKQILKESAIRALWLVLIVFVVYLLQGCDEHRVAPVEERMATGEKARSNSMDDYSAVDAKMTQYRVRAGDTLYSIAFRFKLDYKDLANANDIDRDYRIYPGQVLNLDKARGYEALQQEQPTLQERQDIQTARLNRVRTPTVKKPVRKTPVSNKPPITKPDAHASGGAKKPKGKAPSAQTSAAKKPSAQATNKPTRTVMPNTGNTAVSGRKTPVSQKPSSKRPSSKRPATGYNTSNPISYWIWPHMGRVTESFAASGRKGIDISGNMGDSVKAAAAGRVVYAGRGLRGYGNLLIIKHNANFISAYAHNRKLLVKENEVIKAGQTIAEVGNSDASEPKLHFEIRYKGKPTDPLRYLPKR